MFRRRRGTVHLSLGADEASLLRQVIGEYLGLLDSAQHERTPIIARIFPSASLEDPAVENDYREMVHDDLDALKRENAAAVLAAIGPIGPADSEVSEAQVDPWLALITDLRLAIGVKLEVSEESMETVPDPRDPEQFPLAVLHYLGALQESLIKAAS